MKINFKAVIPKFDSILSRGLSHGLGKRDGQMCIEAAICAALDLPHGDNPECVTSAIRHFKIQLNDVEWSSPQARAKGLRDLGIAQIGSSGVVGDIEFASRMAMKTVNVLIPSLFREAFPDNKKFLSAALKCEQAKTLLEAESAARYAAGYARYAGSATMSARYAESAARSAEYAARSAAKAAAWSAAEYAESAAKYAAGSAEYAARYAAEYTTESARYANENEADKYLLLGASLALDVLRELKSPGCEWVIK